MDNFVVSARKYRPATFDSVVGQKAITSTLQNAIKTNTLAQAFLFCGPRGVGKTTCARIMAKTINCMNPTAEMEACNECESCRSFNNSNSFNIYELDAASNNSVDDIRNLVDQVRIPPQLGRYKVYIIDEVHMLSQAAFNAFLKTLEEPPAYAKFILATTEKHKIIPTILSRCQIFDFKRITVDDIAKHLQNIATKEGVTAEEEALNIIAQKADGALRDALSIFDQMVSFSGNNITYQDVINNLNVLDYEYYFRMVDYILAKDNNSILLLLNDVVEKGFDTQHFIQGLSTHLRNLLLGSDEKIVDLMEVSRQLKTRYCEQARQCSQHFLLKALDLANQCDLNYKSSNNKRLHLEICLLKMCYATQSQSQQVETQRRRDAETQSQSQQVYGITSQQVETQRRRDTETQSQSQGQSQSQSQGQTTNTSSTVREVRTRLYNRIGTISITQEEKTEETTKEEVWNDRFSQEQLTTAWNDFIELYKDKSPAFIAGIKDAKPIIINDSEIHYQIDNILIAREQEHKQVLIEHLKKALHNNQFILKEEIAEHHKEYVPYTDKDKFEKMASQNPNLREIKDSLGLQINL